MNFQFKDISQIFIIAALVAVVIVLLFTKSCNRGGGSVTTVKIDTVWKRDTVQSVSYVPQPYKVVEVKTLPGKVVYRDGETIIEPVDTTAILFDYYASKMYSDTLKTNYGSVVLSDTVTQNRIAGRSWKADFAIPEITKTITIKPKPKLWGIGIQAGYGFTIDGKRQPYVGIGITRNFIRF